jgi:hypothetical protein
MNKQTKLITLGIVAIVVIVGLVFLRTYLRDRTVSTVVNETIDRPALNFAFTFPSGEAAYTFIEPPLGAYGSTTALDAAFILIKTDVYTEFQQIPGGETPKSITLFVFEEPAEATTTAATATDTPRVDRMTRLKNWAQDNASITSIDRAQGTLEELEVDGVKLLHYQTDGLYQQEHYVAFHKNRYYVILGQFDGQDDPERAVLESIVRSISFN